MIRDKRTEKLTISIGANLLFSISFINFIIFHRLTTTIMQILQHIMTHRDICICEFIQILMSIYADLSCPAVPTSTAILCHAYMMYLFSVQIIIYIIYYSVEIDLFRRCNLSSFRTLHPSISFPIGRVESIRVPLYSINTFGSNRTKMRKSDAARSCSS